jgi:hypothetical protein
MSFLVFDYRCGGCGVLELGRFVRASEKDEQPCEGCKGSMTIVHTQAAHLDWDGLAKGSSASPEAIRHFHKKRKDRATKEGSTYREHGDYGKPAGS